MLIAIVLFASVIIGVGVIFAVKNINVDMYVYSDGSEEDYASLKESLGSIKGTCILLVDEQDARPLVEECGYTLISCEKKYPCTLNVTVRQRMEVFAAESGDGYDMYDIDGNFLRHADGNVNSVDLSPNVLLVSVGADDIPSVAQAASEFKSAFGALRSLVASVELDANESLSDVYINSLVFYMHSGVRIVIYDYKNSAAEKINAAFENYSSLTDSRKLRGRILCYLSDGEGAEVKAVYSAD